VLAHNVGAFADLGAVVFYPDFDCKGRPESVSEIGCYKSDVIIQSTSVTCETVDDGEDDN